MSKKVKRRIVEQDEDLHFVLSTKLVPVKGNAAEPAVESDETEEEPTVTEDDMCEEEEEVLVDPTVEEEETSMDVEEETPLATEDDSQSFEVSEEETEEEPVAPLATEEEEEVLPESEEEEDPMPKLSEELGDLNLEQDVKDKIDAAFEAIVREKVARIKEQLETDTEKEVTEAIDAIKESVRLYCEKVAKTFVSQNRLALKESLRLKYFESFFGKVKKLFKENYVEIPESEEELTKELKAENEELKDKADELLKDNVKLAESLLRMTRTAKVQKIASEMFLTDSERFKNATKTLISEKKISEKRFDEKLKTIAEFFAKNNKSTFKTKKLLSEGKLNKTEVKKDEDKNVHPDVLAVLKGW